MSVAVTACTTGNVFQMQAIKYNTTLLQEQGHLTQMKRNKQVSSIYPAEAITYLAETSKVSLTVC